MCSPKDELRRQLNAKEITLAEYLAFSAQLNAER